MIIDLIIFRLINRGEINENDFESIGKAEGIYMKENVSKNFVRTFEDTMQTTVKHRQLKRKVSYRQLIRFEAYKLIRHLIGMEQYKVLKAWW